jgi:hypothetical protein
MKTLMMVDSMKSSVMVLERGYLRQYLLAHVVEYSQASKSCSFPDNSATVSIVGLSLALRCEVLNSFTRDLG